MWKTPTDSIQNWVKWRFARYSGKPKKIKLSQLEIDCLYDVLDSLNISKTEIIDELKTVLSKLEINEGKIKKDGIYYIGDYLHPPERLNWKPTIL